MPVRAAGTAATGRVYQRGQRVRRVSNHGADVERVRVWRRGEGPLAAHAGSYASGPGTVEPARGIDAEVKVGTGQRAGGRVQVSDRIARVQILRGETESWKG